MIFEGHVCLICPTSSKQFFEQVSDAVKRYGLSSLQAEGNIPHISLYATSFATEKLPKLASKLQELAQAMVKDAGSGGLAAEMAGYSITPGGWLMANVKRSALLAKYFKAAGELFETERSLDAKRPFWATSAQEIAAFEAYGDPGFGNPYPHISLLAKTNEAIRQSYTSGKLQAALPQKVSFTFTTLGFFKADANGQTKAMFATAAFTS